MMLGIGRREDTRDEGRGTRDESSPIGEASHSVVLAKRSSIVRRNNAFTLVEVMLAVSILAIGLVGVLRAYAVLVGGLEAAQDSVKAICLLKDKMAEIEEEALKDVNIPAGVNTGGFDTYGETFEWASTTKALDPSDIGIMRVFEEGEEEVKDYLSQMQLAVYNEQVKPVRQVTVWGYVDGYEEE